MEQQWLLQDELKWPRNPLVMHLRTEALVSSASSVQVDERCSCGRCMPVGVARVCECVCVSGQNQLGGRDVILLFPS